MERHDGRDAPEGIKDRRGVRAGVSTEKGWSRVARERKALNCFSLAHQLSYKLLAESDTAPGEGIVKAAEREKANMVVMGTRGMGAMKRLLLGSVSEYVLRHTPVPCVVIPAE